MLLGLFQHSSERGFPLLLQNFLQCGMDFPKLRLTPESYIQREGIAEIYPSLGSLSPQILS